MADWSLGEFKRVSCQPRKPKSQAKVLKLNAQTKEVILFVSQVSNLSQTGSEFLLTLVCILIIFFPDASDQLHLFLARLKCPSAFFCFQP